MAWLHLGSFFLFVLIDSTNSLLASTFSEFGGLGSKTHKFSVLADNLFSAKGSVSRAVSASGVSDACFKAATQESVAPKYIDALGKPASGLAAGNIVWLGSYAVCQNISDSQYCLASNVLFKFPEVPQAVPISWGLCAPQSCNKTDIHLLASELFKLMMPTMTVKWNENSRIDCAHRSEWTTGPIITLVVCSILASLCLVGTLVDLCLIQQSWKFWVSQENFQNKKYAEVEESQVRDESTPLLHSNVSASKSTSLSYIKVAQPSESERGFLLRFLTCFSITRNTSKIMDCTVPPGAITSVNGVRVLSMWWVILGHTFIWLLQNGVLNDALLAFNIIHRFTFNTINSAFFSVDSFFLLSGLLVGYLAFRRLEKNEGRLPLFQFYFHRFWRLTPSYMFAVLFFSNLYAFLGDGPVWFRNQNSTACDEYWWTNLLYINNFYPTSLNEVCLNWSWYLANDMQFYVISPVLLLLVFRFKWTGLVLSVGGLLGVSFIVTAVIIGHYDIPVLLLSALGEGANPTQPPKKGLDFMNKVYVKPYCRIAPYLVGIVLGYLIHVEKSTPSQSPLRKIRRQIVCVVGWLVATALGVLVVYGIYGETKKGGTQFNKAENIAYGTFSRFTWGLALAWVIYACNKGYGSLVDKLLSASYWIPLSRMTYSAYLVHPMVLGIYFGSFQHTVEYTDRLMAFYFVSAVVMSYAAAFVLAVCVELPMMQLENVLFFRNKKQGV
ncbi:nose resistant to fluoxetine protein 6-like [Acropora palmata]|uniref:nose resistant to fluoxetine protein 6-like n=1 Tax=Acropora palmata TaxID=6131 RepID=UPI003DA17F2C